MKKYFYSLLFLFLSVHLLQGTTSAEIEAQMEKAQGRERIRLLSQLTDEYRVADPKKVIQYGQEALKLLGTFPNDKARSHILTNMSIAYRFLDECNISEEYARTSLALAEQIDDKRCTADACISLANTALALDRLDQALEYFSKGAKLYEDLNDFQNLALAYNSIAGTYWKWSEYPTAMDYLLKSLSIYEELNDQKGIGWLNNNLGILYWEWKDYDKSLEHLLKSLKADEERKDKVNIIISLNSIGQLYRLKKMYEKSLESLQRALDIAIEVGRNSLLSDTYLYMGETYDAMGDDHKALEYLSLSLKLKEEVTGKKGISRVLIQIANVNLRRGEYQEAVQQAHRALTYAKELKVKAEISDAYKVLARLYEAQGDLRHALDYQKKFNEINDEIFNDNTNKRIADLEKNYEITKRNRENDLLRRDQEYQRNVLAFLIIFAFLILLLAFVLYTRYRLKARVTRALEKEIADRIQTEQKLRESEEKFRVLAEKSVVGIWIIQDNLVKYANPRSLNTFGYPPEEMIGKNPLELVVAEDRPKVSENLLQRLKGENNTLSYEFKGITKTGDIINLDSYGSLTYYQGQPAVLESVIDITRRKQTEAELTKSRRMESVGILAGGIAHDFNNLLAIIVGNTSMLRLSLGRGDPRNINFLENVEKASAQAAELAQKFITFSEGGWLLRKRVEFVSILKDTAFLSPEVKNISCNIFIPPDLHPIYGDERQLRQVVTNLLLNAHEATSDDDKKITLQAKNITLGKDNSFSLTPGKYVKISVIDNGKGIPPEFLDKIFDPYFSTKDTMNQKGLGLGLAICYSIVKKHEGHIAINSEANKGTTVDLYLPIYRE